jgi:uncharacterized surface protein with fasciclin (FAS1) repeats
MLKYLVFFLCFIAFSYQQNIPAKLSADPQFSSLVTAVTDLGLVDTLSGTGPFTVFAPTNAALATYAASGLGNFIPVSADFLLSHVLVGNYSSSQITNNLKIDSARDDDPKVVRFNVYPGNPTVVTVNGAPITAVDNYADNGVIHTLGNFPIIPTLDIAASSTAVNLTTIVSLILENPTFLALLSDPSNNFTIFAPNDAAFAAFNRTYPGILSNPQNVAAVLSNHVVPSVFYSAGIPAGTTNGLPTAGGVTTLSVTKTGNAVTVRINSETSNTANVVIPNLPVVPGVVHIIDQVLYAPPQVTTVQQTTVQQTTAAAPGATTAAAPANSSASFISFNILLTVFAIFLSKFL